MKNAVLGMNGWQMSELTNTVSLFKGSQFLVDVHENICIHMKFDPYVTYFRNFDKSITQLKAIYL